MLHSAGPQVPPLVRRRRANPVPEHQLPVPSSPSGLSQVLPSTSIYEFMHASWIINCQKRGEHARERVTLVLPFTMLVSAWVGAESQDSARPLKFNDVYNGCFYINLIELKSTVLGCYAVGLSGLLYNAACDDIV